jgi:hypothetical protein
MEISRNTSFYEWFKESKVVNENGQPLTVYHGTNSKGDFNTFKLMGKDIGIHFGTIEHAECRLNSSDDYEYSRLIPVFLNIKNPLEVEDIFGTPYTFFRKMCNDDCYEGYGILTDEEEKYIWLKYGDDFEQTDYWHTLNDAEFYKDMLNFITSKGYDGFKYLNDVEKDGSSNYEYSWVVFNPEQIKGIYTIN